MVIDTSKFNLIGHRGGGWREPENTLRAMRAGVSRGATAIEIDVHETLDGQLIVCHDPYVDRTTNGEGKIREMTLKEIRELDAGKGERIPTIDEVLRFCRENDIGLVYEIKAPDIEQKSVEMLRHYDMVENTIVESFLQPSVVRIKELDSEICSLLNYDQWAPAKNPERRVKRIDRMIKKVRELGLDGVSPQFLNVDVDMVTKVKDEKLLILVWVPISKRAIQKAFNWQLHGVITDRPEKVLRVLGGSEN